MITAKEAKILSQSKSTIDRILETLDGDVRAAAEDGLTQLTIETEEYKDRTREQLIRELEDLGYNVTTNSWSITLNWSIA